MKHNYRHPYDSLTILRDSISAPYNKIERCSCMHKLPVIPNYAVSIFDDSLYFQSITTGFSSVLQRAFESKVPEDKIINRYSRSLDNLFEAVKLSDRAFLFDNSESKAKLYVEYDADQDGAVLFHKDRVPFWIKEYFIDKI